MAHAAEPAGMPIWEGAGVPGLCLTCAPFQPVRPSALRPTRQDTPPKRHLITPVPGQSESHNLGERDSPGDIGTGRMGLPSLPPSSVTEVRKESSVLQAIVL